MCDGYPDCIVGEDEEGDYPECCQFGYRCASGRCLPANRVCDGKYISLVLIVFLIEIHLILKINFFNFNRIQ